MTVLDVGVFLLRVAVGTVFVVYGCRKLTGWFGGSGLSATAQAFETMGLRPGRVTALAAALTEVLGGALTLVGLAWPAGPAALFGCLVVAAGTQASRGFWATHGGIELPALYAVCALTLGLSPVAGPVADLQQSWLTGPERAWLVMVAAGVAALAVLAQWRISLGDAGRGRPSSVSPSFNRDKSKGAQS